MSGDDKLIKFFRIKNKYQEQYNKQRTKLKDAGNLSPTEIRAELLQYSSNRKCSECSKSGGISFEETKDILVAKCLAQKPCFSINIKRHRVSDLWESHRINKLILEGLYKSIIIMKHHSQYYFPTEQLSRKTSLDNSRKNPSNKGSKYNIGMTEVSKDFSDIENKLHKEKKKERDIETAINKVINNNAQEIADIELNISEIQDTLREFQSDDNDTILKKIALNREQQTNYDSLRPLKYAYFAIEGDDETPPDFSLITREFSTQQCEYTI